MSDPTAATPTPAAPSGPSIHREARHKRKLSNYLLDKQLQLRYVVIITLLSGLIAGTLGYLIFDQQSQSTASIEHKLEELTDKEDAENITGDYESEDRILVYKMVVAGIGLVVILSLFLVVMTHKVAGPLYKTSIYFDRMAEGKLGNVTPLRQGDMLQDFYTKFKAMHDAVRMRALEDIAAMEKALAELRAAGNPKLAEELDAFEKHIEQIKKQTDASRVAKPTGAPVDAADTIRKHARTALTAGIIGIFFAGLVFGTGALIRAHLVKRDIHKWNIGHEHLHTAKAATVLGVIGVVAWVVAIGLYVVAVR